MNDQLKEEARHEVLKGIQYEDGEKFEYGAEDPETVLLAGTRCFIDSALVQNWAGEKPSLQSTGERAEKKGKQIQKNKQINT